MKCIQVDVKRREVSKCYQELPVVKDDKDYFLTPKTHILKQFGTETTCNPLIPPMFLLGDDWFTILPRGATKGLQPTILKPNTKNNWNYTDPVGLAKSGIYSAEEVQALKNHLMFPVERAAMLNTIALGMSGKSSDRNGLSIARLFDEEVLTQLAKSTWKKMWGRFMSFGSASAAVIGLFMIARLIKFLIDTILHGYALYSLYGWSLHIIGSIWNSVTQLLLHAARDKPTRKNQTSKETTPTAPPPPPNAPAQPPKAPPPFVPPPPFIPPTAEYLPKTTLVCVKEGRNGGEIVENSITSFGGIYPVLDIEPNISSLQTSKKRKQDGDSV